MESESRALFCHVRDCVQALRDEPLRINRMREACVMPARSGGPRGKGGVSDPMRRVDALIDYTARSDAEAAEMRPQLKRAAAMLATLRQVDPLGATIVYNRYLLLRRWEEIAGALKMPMADVRGRETMAFERMDSEGAGAMLYGQMGATLAEGEDRNRNAWRKPESK